ncbi:MAG TPA: hypothetical protein V6D07_18870 [Trichocoleus sp.]
MAENIQLTRIEIPQTFLIELAKDSPIVASNFLSGLTQPTLLPAELPQRSQPLPATQVRQALLLPAPSSLGSLPAPSDEAKMLSKIPPPMPARQPTIAANQASRPAATFPPMKSAAVGFDSKPKESGGCLLIVFLVVISVIGFFIPVAWDALTSSDIRVLRPAETPVTEKDQSQESPSAEAEPAEPEGPPPEEVKNLPEQPATQGVPDPVQQFLQNFTNK